jgi:hypothetical protein
MPDAIEQACIEQIAFWYQQRERLGLRSFSGEGGTGQLIPQLDLLPHVQSILRGYRRIQL